MKYFLHDTSAFDDEKVSELFMNFGYEGLGLFYTILEKIGKQEKPIKTIVLKRQLKVGKKLDKCWSFMEEIELISSNNGETFNKQLLNFSEKYQIKKEKNAKRISEWREKQSVTENVTRSENVRNTPKVKESKVNRSKENNNLFADEESGTKEPPLKVVKKGAPSLYSLMVDRWLKLHSDFIFTGKDGTKIKSIIKKTQALFKKKGTDETDENILEFFDMICSNLPEFYKNKELSVIDQGFNTLVEELKKSPHGNQQQLTKQQSTYESTKQFFGTN